MSGRPKTQQGNPTAAARHARLPFKDRAWALAPDRQSDDQEQRQSCHEKRASDYDIAQSAAQLYGRRTKPSLDANHFKHSPVSVIKVAQIADTCRNEMVTRSCTSIGATNWLRRG